MILILALVVLAALGVVIWGLAHADNATAYTTVIGSGVVFALAVVALVAMTPASLWGGEPLPPRAQSVAITYQITGTVSTASVAYKEAANRSVQRSAIPLPWEGTFTIDRGQLLYLTATGQDAGRVTCRILQGDTLLFESSGEGAIPSALCSGYVPL